MKLKCGNDVIDVPENKVAYFLHMGYVKVENEATVIEEPDSGFTLKKKPASEKPTWKDD